MKVFSIWIDPDPMSTFHTFVSHEKNMIINNVWQPIDISLTLFQAKRVKDEMYIHRSAFPKMPDLKGHAADPSPTLFPTPQSSSPASGQ